MTERFSEADARIIAIGARWNNRHSARSRRMAKRRTANESQRPMSSTIQQIADALASANALVVTAGAGMGVDSGLPDFRGTAGFWQAYPPFAKLGLRFEQLANPRWFRDDPALAWGFYGHRLSTYRATQPHAGFEILKRWAAGMRHGGFVYTSNVDGAFQKAGFADDRIYEVHGTIHRLQCLHECGAEPFSADSFEIEIDAETMRAREPFPSCPQCGRLARPNVLMFGDAGWDERHSSSQSTRMTSWCQSIRGSSIVVVECGAGTAVPTVRMFGEQLADVFGALLVRINVREPQTPSGIGIARGAKETLLEIDAAMKGPKQ
jgi:NAD-dependent SIR2 family protein deacetylase